MKEIHLNPGESVTIICDQQPQPQPTGDWKAKLIIKNMTNAAIKTTGEIRLYVEGHVGVNTYLPGAYPSAGALYTIQKGENDLSNYDVHGEGNGFTLDDSYDGKPITEVRMYDYRHYNNGDWTPAGIVTLDTADSRCSKVLRKAGATYVIKIEQ